MESDSQTVAVVVNVSDSLDRSRNTTTANKVSKDRSCSSFSSVMQVFFTSKDLVKWCCDTNDTLLSHDEQDRLDVPSVENALCHIFQKLNGHTEPVPTPDTNALKRALETFVGGPIEKNEDPGSLINNIVHALHFQDVDTDRTDVLQMWSIDVRRTIEYFDRPNANVMCDTVFTFDVTTFEKSLWECILDNFVSRSVIQKSVEPSNGHPYAVSDHAWVTESVCGLPQILCVTLRRLVRESRRDDVYPDKSITTFKKTTKSVKFEESLTIGNECDASNKGQLFGKYRLYALITHTGTCHQRYFRAYVKCNECWFLVDDTRAWPVDWTRVGALHGSDDETGKIAYMLFYRKD